MPYSLLASEDTVQVLSPTLTNPATRATIQSPIHGVIAASIVPDSIWGSQAGADQLAQVAWDVDYIIDHTAAVSAVGTQSIDSNGLLQQQVTFTIEYTPPGSTLPPLTATVDVPNTLLEEIIAPDGPHPGLDAALAIVNAAVTSLEAMAKG